LSFGTYSEPRGLDPIVATGYGVTGGVELSALYDTLVRYDPETKKYVMRTAESLTADEAFKEWTLKVRPNIKFGDGTPYDAAAGKFNSPRTRWVPALVRSRSSRSIRRNPS
jgi:peptide/nickel transport system substrate-binding protein